nr:adenylate/guanylyl cyclase [uncultured Mediterranean phage uvMED]
MYKWWTVLITIALLVGLRVSDPFLMESIRLNYFDFLQTQKEPLQVEDIVLVDIDEKALEKYGQFPFPRGVWAEMISKTPETSPSVLTATFAQPDRFGEDEELRNALGNKLTLLSASPTNQKDTGSAPYIGIAKLGKGLPENWLYSYEGISSPIQTLQEAVYGVGTVSASPSIDGTIRAVPLAVMANNQIYPSLALETLRVLNGQQSYNIKITPEVGVEWLRIGRLPPLTVQPNADFNIAFWNQFERVSAVEELPADKILIWGLTASGLSNPVSTPVGAMYPHEVQANLIQTVLTGFQIQRFYYLEFLEIFLVLISSLVILVMVYRLPTVLSGIGSLGVVGLQAYTGYYVWIENLILLDVFYSSVASLLVFGHASFNKYFTTYQLKEQIKKQFQKYLSPDMVEELQKDPSKLRLGGERKEMTFMFMDIIGFTPISEAYKNNDDPEGLVELINKFLDMQTKIIINNRGTIDKYMGDCIMSFWNAPLDCKNHAELAIKSAVEVLKATKKLNAELKPLNLPPINVGIGISTGECIVGNMGSEIRFDYSVIGDAVNLGARLEGQTRNYDGVNVLLSERTRELCPRRKLKEVDRIKVKGKSEKVTIYTV